MSTTTSVDQELGPVLETERLRLRPWHDSDLEPFAQLCADPRVMEYFPALMTRDECQAAIIRFRDHFARHGFGLWSLEAPGVCAHAGFVGLSVVRFPARFTPAVEIGWRLAARWWNRGWATEAAREAVHFGFETLGLDQIVSFTIPENQRSRRVMEKLGMRHDPSGDFLHPSVPPGHPMRRHVLYRLERASAIR